MVQKICILQSLGRLLVQSSGQLSLLDSDSLEGEFLTGAKVGPEHIHHKTSSNCPLLIEQIEEIVLQGLTAFDLRDTAGKLPLLAVATRITRKEVGLLLFQLQGHADRSSQLRYKAVCIQRREFSQDIPIKVCHCPSMQQNQVILLFGAASYFAQGLS